MLDLDRPVHAMKKKLTDYFNLAKAKSVYSSATFVDPRIKNEYAKGDKRAYREIRKKFEEDLQPFAKAYPVTEPTDEEQSAASWVTKTFRKRKVVNKIL